MPCYATSAELGIERGREGSSWSWEKQWLGRFWVSEGLEFGLERVSVGY